MSIGKRLINTGAGGGATPSCTTDTTDIFGDSSGLALYSFDYDASAAPDATTYSGTSNDIEFGNDAQINWGARFNGSSSFINTNFTVPASSTFTISWWMNANPSGGGSDNDYIMGDSGTAGSGDTFNVFLNGSSIGLVGAGFYVAAGSINSCTGSWMHFVLVLNGTTLNFYKDGSLAHTASITARSAAGTNTLVLGRYGHYAGGTQFNFSGDIDQVRIFNRALLTDNSGVNEIDTLYSETACVYTGTTQSHLFGCIANYNLDGDAKESMGVTAYDGTESNVSYKFGRFGTAALLDGSTVAADISLGSSFISAFDVANKSFSLWFNWDGSNPGSNGYGMPFFMNGSGLSNGRIGVQITNSNGTLTAYSGTSASAPTTTISANRWYHFALVVSGSNYEAFVNGNSIGSTTTDTYVDSGTTAAYIGQFFSSNYYFTGSVDQARFFNSSLSDSNVTYLFENEKQAYITKNASNPFGDGNEVSFYKMENNSNDSTGSNSGSDSYITYTTSDALFGTYSASFNGSNSYIALSDGSLQITTLSISAWINPSSLSSSGSNMILETYGYSGGSKGWLFRVAATKLDFIGYATDPANTQLTSTASITLNTWTHVAVVFVANTTGKLYINGSKATLTSQAVGTPTFFSSENTTIGALRYGGGSGQDLFAGKIDQVRIFNRALEGDEIFKLYAEVIN